MCSRRSHWHAGAGFAGAGCLTLMPNYRLAPAAPFPAALSDLCALWSFLLAHAEAWGGDAEQIFLAGESAGANLIAALSAQGFLDLVLQDDSSIDFAVLTVTS